MTYTCYCGKVCKSKWGFKRHVQWHNSKSKVVFRGINFVALVLGIIASLLAVVLLPMPWFDNHNIWNDLIGGDVKTNYIRNDFNRLSFQVINNRPYLIDDVKISMNLDCFDDAKIKDIPLKSELVSIPSGQGDIFYIANEELLALTNTSKDGTLKYFELNNDYFIAYVKKGENIYLIDQKGNILKNNSLKEIPLLHKFCNLEGTLDYSYKRFGRNGKSPPEIIKRLVIVPLARITTTDATDYENRNVSESKGWGVKFLDLCEERCPECAIFKDGSDEKSSHCALWICNQIKDEYPLDNISCSFEFSYLCQVSDIGNPMCTAKINS